MVPHSSIDARDVNLEHGRLVGTGGTSTSGLELVSGSRVVEASKGFGIGTDGVGGFGGGDGE